MVENESIIQICYQYKIMVVETRLHQKIGKMTKDLHGSSIKKCEF